MKMKFLMAMAVAAVLAGCEQRQDRMNEPAGAERPAYQTPSPSTNESLTTTNHTGASGTQTNGGSSSGTGSSATP